MTKDRMIARSRHVACNASKRLRDTFSPVVLTNANLIDEHHSPVAVTADQLVGQELAHRLFSVKRGELHIRLNRQEHARTLDRVRQPRSWLGVSLLEASDLQGKAPDDLLISGSKPPDLDTDSPIVKGKRLPARRSLRGRACLSHE
jgi:hypothetical protein